MTTSSNPSGSPPVPRRRRREPGITTTQILAVVTLVVTLYFLVDISRRAIIGYRLHRQTVELEQEIVSLQAEQERLHRLKEYVRSDEYVARVAREELKMVRPGERLYVIVVQAPEPGAKVATLLQNLPPLPPGYAQLKAPSQSDSHLAEWWAVFFDSPFPGAGAR